MNIRRTDEYVRRSTVINILVHEIYYNHMCVCMWSIKQKNTQYYAVGRNSGGRAQATHTYGARPMESRKLMTSAACITEVASANTMAEDMAARWCARYVLGDVLDVP